MIFFWVFLSSDSMIMNMGNTMSKIKMFDNKILSAHLAVMSLNISVPRDRHANPAVKYCNKRIVVLIAQILL